MPFDPPLAEKPEVQWTNVSSATWYGTDGYDEYWVKRIPPKWVPKGIHWAVVKGDGLWFDTRRKLADAFRRAEYEAWQAILRSNRPGWYRKKGSNPRPDVTVYDGPDYDPDEVEIWQAEVRTWFDDLETEFESNDIDVSWLDVPASREKRQPIFRRIVMAATTSTASKKPVAVAAPAATAAHVKEKKAPAPPKTLIGGTQEEYTAAVAGKLQPRPVKGKKDQESLLQRTEGGERPVGRPLGVTTGLPIMLAGAYVLQQNEIAPAGKKLEDSEITAWLKKEFPGRATNCWDSMGPIRAQYNQGRFTKGVPPRIQSHRFNKDGSIVPPGTRGRAPGAKAGSGATTAKAVAKTVAKAPAATVAAPAKKSAVRIAKPVAEVAEPETATA